MHLCRLCGEEKSPLDFNMELSDLTSSNWSYRELIEFHSRITLKTNKLLPQGICEECRSQVDGFAEFSQKLQEVQQSIDHESESETPEALDCFMQYDDAKVSENAEKRRTRSTRRNENEHENAEEIPSLTALELQITVQDSDKIENGEVAESALAQMNLIRWSSLVKHCELCGEGCNNVFDLHSHYLENHIDHLTEFACSLCESRFAEVSFSEFANHSVVEHAEHLKHCCFICDKIFVNLNFVRNHMQSEHSNVTFLQCIACGEYYGADDDLQRHSVHHLSQDNLCRKRQLEVADTQISTKRCKSIKDGLDSESGHEENVSSDDNGRLKIRKKKKNNIRGSKRRNAGKVGQLAKLGSEFNTFEKLFADELKGTSDLSTNLHVNTSEMNQMSTGEIHEEHALKVSALRWKDLLSCGICKSSFSSITDLLQHGDTKHKTRSKLFHCQECEGEFSANCESPLINHLVERHHHEHLKFCCLICSKMFFDLKKLIIHNKTHGGNSNLLVCLVCGWYAKTFEDLREHKALHLTIEKSENQLLCEQIYDKFKTGTEPTIRNHCVSEHERNADGTVKQECQERFSIDWSFGQYQCVPCKLTYVTPFELFIHQRLKHPKEVFKKNFFCTLCTDKKDYSNLFTFVNHATSKHLDNVKFTCIICSTVFWNYLALANHYKNVHPSFPCILCCHCGKLFMNATVASSHFKSLNLMLTPEQRKLVKEGKLETEASIHICHVCARCFKSRGTLLNHLKTHEILEPSDLLQCHICSKFYKNKYKLLQHQVCHENFRSWKCKICGQAFNYKKLLQRHIQAVHDNERPFGCTFCDKKFNSKYDLTVHVRLHTGDFPYECPIADCDAKYPAWSNLFKHCQSRHKLDIRSEGYKKLKATQKIEKS